MNLYTDSCIVDGTTYYVVIAVAPNKKMILDNVHCIFYTYHVMTLETGDFKNIGFQIIIGNEIEYHDYKSFTQHYPPPEDLLEKMLDFGNLLGKATPTTAKITITNTTSADNLAVLGSA